MAAAARSDDAPHVPVLLGPLLAAVAPVTGHWVDGTLGAGGYARGLLKAGATRVTGIDRDPLALAMAADWGAAYGARFRAVEGNFADLDDLAGGAVDGVALDLGVSSMQLDDRGRGFSFMGDGPLDMRMGQSGLSAADLVNAASEAELADVLYHYGEERAARRIARAIVAARAEAPIETTARLARLDVLIVDLPPGTGDVAMTLCQRSEVTGAILVSTPQDVALLDARKAIDMFQTLKTPILGLIENMSTYICPNCGHEEHLFGQGGVRAEAEKLGVPLLAEIPLALEVRVAGDAGTPVALGEGPVAQAYAALAARLVGGGMA